MQKISEYFFSLLLCAILGVIPGWAQQPDSVQQEKKFVGKGFTPSALRLGLSLNNIVETVLEDQSTYYGFQIDVPVRQFMFSVDYGRMDISRNNQQTEQPSRNFTYSSQGSFFRAGVDVNLLKDKATDSNDAFGDIIFFGLKYARSRLDDQLSFQTAGDSIYEATPLQQSNDKLRAWWLEMNAGVKVEIFKNIFLGYTLRYKFFRRFSDKTSLTPYEVPGFGKGEQENAFGYDYYIFYRIPFRK